MTDDSNAAHPPGMTAVYDSTDTMPRGLRVIPTSQDLVRYSGPDREINGCLGWIEESALLDGEPRFLVAMSVGGTVVRVAGVPMQALKIERCRA